MSEVVRKMGGEFSFKLLYDCGDALSGVVDFGLRPMRKRSKNAGLLARVGFLGVASVADGGENTSGVGFACAGGRK